jgi:predicted MFS family arabinose efflux permease
VGLLSAGTVLTVLFCWWETRAAEPILPLGLFANRVFSVSVLVLFLVGCAMFGGIVFLPVYLQVVTGATATTSGLLMLPLMCGILASSVASGRVIARTGRYKAWPLTGLAVAALGMVLLSRMDTDTSRLGSSTAMLVLGLGLGMVMQVIILAVQNAVPQDDLGVATSAATFFRSMGGSFGVAVFGAILTSRLATELPRLLPAGTPAEGASSVLNSPEQIRRLPPAVAEAVAEALSRSLHSVFLWAVPVLLVGLAVCWLLDELPLRQRAPADEDPQVAAATSAAQR